ncbi:MAG TPA: flagellar hook-basal body complex protein FliE [Nitrospirota bacterium]|nr:flagellar hook-basal body complex protein FliE [Nitrospirota bacterium]
MSDIRINGAGAPQGVSHTGPTEQASGAGFDKIMDEAMGKLSQVQHDAEQAVHELTSGGDPAEAIIAMEKANMNFQLMVEVRNKLIAAYQEIMRMQV